MNQMHVAVGSNSSRWGGGGGVAATDLTRAFTSLTRKTVRSLLMTDSV